MELSEKIKLLRLAGDPVRGVEQKTLLTLNVGSVLEIKTTNTHRFLVEEVYDYVETNKKGDLKSFAWREYMLRDLSDFSTCFLEVEDDDGLSVYLTTQKISQGRLSEIPDKTVKKLHVEGVDVGTLYLEETSTAVFNKQGEEPEHVSLFDYESDSGEMLGVEVWEDGNCFAFFYIEINLTDIGINAHDF